jgi:PAS domain S-box-containing protein
MGSQNMSASDSHSSEPRIEATGGDLRKTGISVIGDVRWGTHFCCFYETKPDLLDTLVSYFKEGLAHHEFCLWVISQALTVEEAKCALGQAVPDLERHLAAGALEIHSHDKWYLRDGAWDPQRVLQSWRDKLNQAWAKGYVGLRGAGDGGWIQNEGWTAFRDYERQVNVMIADQRGIILCTYPLTTSPGHQVFDVAHIHQAAMARRNGNWEVIETSAFREAKAEIKRLNDELEQRVMDRTRELATANEALRSEIAERKLAEEFVRQAEDRTRLIIDTIPTMAWSLRPDGVLDFVNQRWVDYTGVSFQDAMREPNGIVHPEELLRVVQNWLGDMAAGKPSEEEMRLRRGDGEYRWFLVRTVPLRDKKGDIIKWYGTSSDIEDRKQAELLSRKLIDAIPHQIWSGPADGTLDYCNERWRDYMGLDLEDLCGHGWQSMLHPDDRDRVLEAWRRSVANGAPYELEERHRGADGTYRWFLARGVPLRDAEGHIVRWYGTNTDIEERKQAQEALNAQALRYKTLMETSTDSIYVLDQNGDLQEANAAFLRGRGYTAAEMKDLNIADWDARWTREQLQARLRRLAGGSAVFETQHRRKDGSVFDVEVCSTSVLIGGEQLFFVVTRDISERKQAEDQLRRSEEKFKALFGIAPVGISVLDRQHNMADANPALERIMRLSREELLGGMYRRRSYLNADGTPKPPDEFPSEHAVAQDQPINDVEVGIVAENGEIIWTQVSVAPLALPEASAVVITQDITQRKHAEQALRESEERFRELAENINEVFWIWTATPGNARCLYVSPAYATIWGRSCESLYASPQSWMKALHPQDKERVQKEGARMDFGNISDWTYRIVRPDQSIRWIRDRIFPVRDVRGAVVRFAGIAEDITESKEAEEAVRKANRQLRILSRRRIQEQEAERRRLSRELHDQIGQSLTAAKINVEALRSTKNPALVGRIDETAAILDQLLGQVRQISLNLRPPMLDDLGLVPALRSFIDEQGRRASVAVRFSAEHVPEKLDPEIEITCFRIAQEAITNAMRHAKATQLEIALRCARGKTLRLLARDNGIGFDAQARQVQAFDLGLTGIRERAALVGGRVKIISSPRKGTTIDVSLPLTLRPERQGRHVENEHDPSPAG